MHTLGRRFDVITTSQNRAWPIAFLQIFKTASTILKRLNMRIIINFNDISFKIIWLENLEVTSDQEQVPWHHLYQKISYFYKFDAMILICSRENSSLAPKEQMWNWFQIFPQRHCRFFLLNAHGLFRFRDFTTWHRLIYHIIWSISYDIRIVGYLNLEAQSEIGPIWMTVEINWISLDILSLLWTNSRCSSFTFVYWSKSKKKFQNLQVATYMHRFLMNRQLLTGR